MPAEYDDDGYDIDDVVSAPAVRDPTQTRLTLQNMICKLTPTTYVTFNNSGFVLRYVMYDKDKCLSVF